MLMGMKKTKVIFLLDCEYNIFPLCKKLILCTKLCTFYYMYFETSEHLPETCSSRCERLNMMSLYLSQTPKNKLIPAVK